MKWNVSSQIVIHHKHSAWTFGLSYNQTSWHHQCRISTERSMPSYSDDTHMFYSFCHSASLNIVSLLKALRIRTFSHYTDLKSETYFMQECKWLAKPAAWR